MGGGKGRFTRPGPFEIAVETAKQRAILEKEQAAFTAQQETINRRNRFSTHTNPEQYIGSSETFVPRAPAPMPSFTGANPLNVDQVPNRYRNAPDRPPILDISQDTRSKGATGRGGPKWPLSTGKKVNDPVTQEEYAELQDRARHTQEKAGVSDLSAISASHRLGKTAQFLRLRLQHADRTIGKTPAVPTTQQGKVIDNPNKLPEAPIVSEANDGFARATQTLAQAAAEASTQQKSVRITDPPNVFDELAKQRYAAEIPPDGQVPLRPPHNDRAAFLQSRDGVPLEYDNLSDYSGRDDDDATPPQISAQRAAENSRW